MTISAAAAQFADVINGSPGNISVTGVAVNDIIYVAVTHDISQVRTIVVSDNQGNSSYTQIGSLLDDVTDGQRILHYYARATVAATHVVTTTISGNQTSTHCGHAVSLITGNSVVPLLVGNGPGQLQAAPGTGTDAITSGAAQTPSALPALGIAFSMDTSNGDKAPAAGTGFTSLGTGWPIGATDSVRLEWIRSTAGTMQATFTTQAASGGRTYLTQLAIFAELGALVAVGFWPQPQPSYFFVGPARVISGYFQLGSGIYVQETIRKATPRLQGIRQVPGMELLASTAFTSNGTWTKNARSVLVQVDVVGGGGSGAGASTTKGASGGGGGGRIFETFLASDFGSTETVTVGAAVTGGTGANGVAGNFSSFGGKVIAYGGGAGLLSGVGTVAGGAGGGGAQSVGQDGQAAATSLGGQPVNVANQVGQYGGGGGAATASAAAQAVWGGGAGGCSVIGATGGSGGNSYYGGGGGGGGADFSAAQASVGGAGGGSGARTDSAVRGSGGAGGSAAGGAGTAGAAGTDIISGAGGGGGGTNGSTTGGAGANGGIPGGGGGGGGRGTIGADAGGNGARGEVRVYEWG